MFFQPEKFRLSVPRGCPCYFRGSLGNGSLTGELFPWPSWKTRGCGSHAWERGNVALPMGGPHPSSHLPHHLPPSLPPSLPALRVASRTDVRGTKRPQDRNSHCLTTVVSAQGWGIGWGAGLLLQGALKPRGQKNDGWPCDVSTVGAPGAAVLSCVALAPCGSAALWSLGRASRGGAEQQHAGREHGGRGHVATPAWQAALPCPPHLHMEG